MLGTLVVGWDTTHQVDVAERTVPTAITGHMARAIERALYLDQRVPVLPSCSRQARCLVRRRAWSWSHPW
jgi:hypothetical protein